MIAGVITHRSNLAVPISSILAYNRNQDNHLDNIGGIRTRAIEIVNVFEMKFRWEKDILWKNLRVISKLTNRFNHS